MIGYYPHLISLYRHLGFPLQPTPYTFSFSHLLPPFTSPKHQTHFIYGGNTGLSAPSLPTRAYTSFWSSLGGVWHWLEYAICFVLLIALAFMMWHDLLPTDLANASLEQFTDGICTVFANPLPLIYTPLGRMWRHFTEDILVPLYSAVGTMPTEDLWRTPARVVLEYVHAGVGSPHYVLKGYGAAEVARRLAAAVEQQGSEYLRLGQQVVDFTVGGRGVVLHISDSQGDESSADEVEVDTVVIATQPSAARSILDMMGEALFRSGDKAELRLVRQMRQAVGEVESRVSLVNFLSVGELKSRKRSSSRTAIPLCSPRRPIGEISISLSQSSLPHTSSTLSPLYQYLRYPLQTLSPLPALLPPLLDPSRQTTSCTSLPLRISARASGPCTPWQHISSDLQLA